MVWIQHLTQLQGGQVGGGPVSAPETDRRAGSLMSERGLRARGALRRWGGRGGGGAAGAAGAAVGRLPLGLLPSDVHKYGTSGFLVWFTLQMAVWDQGTAL